MATSDLVPLAPGSAPCIYRCAECGSVVTDSAVCLGTCPGLKILCAQGASESVTVLKQERVEKTAGPLRSSAYLEIECTCKQKLGRVYLTARGARYAFLCNKYAFSLDKISTYIFGSSRRAVQTDEDEAGPSAAVDVGASLSVDGGALGDRVKALEAKFDQLEEGMLLVQHQVFLQAQEFIKMGRTMGIDQEVLQQELQATGADVGAVEEGNPPPQPLLLQQQHEGAGGGAGAGNADPLDALMPQGKKQKIHREIMRMF